MKPTPRRAQRQSLAGARLRKHADYQRAYASSRKRQSASMTWFLAPQTAVRPSADASVGPETAEPSPFHIGPRVGLTAGKVLGKATERNRIKRRMKEALRRHVGLLPGGFDLIFHPRRAVLTMDFMQLEAEIVRILEQARELISAEAARNRKLDATAPESCAKSAS
ncbi:MAG: ribonuclease P protein component [Terracidiphilus sp.]